MKTLCGTILAAAVFAVTCANSATVADENAGQVNKAAAVFEGKIPAKIASVSEVSVTPQVSGEILEVCFVNGQKLRG